MKDHPGRDQDHHLIIDYLRRDQDHIQDIQDHVQDHQLDPIRDQDQDHDQEDPFQDHQVLHLLWMKIQNQIIVMIKM